MARVRADATPLGHRLMGALAEGGVAHVYWKSRRGLLDAYERPEKDLDLLVRPDAASTAVPILERLGYKEMAPPLGAPRLPGVLHFVGCDQAYGQLSHVHFHTAIYSGRPQLMEWSLPFVDALVARAEHWPLAGAHVLEPATDWVLLAIRGALEPKLGAFAPRPPERLSRELEALGGLVTESERIEVARALLGARAAARLPGARPDETIWSRWVATVRSSMAPHRRLSSTSARAAWSWVRARSLGAAVAGRAGWTPPARGLRRRGRGLLIALVGADGSGKTTQAKALRTWLEPLFAVEEAYFGRGDVVSEAKHALAQAKWATLERLGHRRPSEPDRVSMPGAFQTDRARTRKGYMVQMSRDLSRIALAERKRRELERVEVALSRGALLVTDRFPHPTVFELDGPGIRLGSEDPGWRAALAGLERRVFEAMESQPDLLFRLRIDPAVAHQRKPDHSPRRIAEKAAAIDGASFPGATVVDVDASRPAAEVAREIRATVWKAL